MDTAEHAKAAVKGLAGQDIGGRRLRIELCRGCHILLEYCQLLLCLGDGAIKRREEVRNRAANLVPNETLFVVNFDPTLTREETLRRASVHLASLFTSPIITQFFQVRTNCAG